MDIMDTINATTMPTSSRMASSKEKMRPNLNSFNALAPNITGIARKNVYSVATTRLVPNKIPPSIVEPERDVPGTSESTWKKPMMSAVL